MSEQEPLSTHEVTEAVFAALTIVGASSRQGRIVAISMLAAMAGQQPCRHARLAFRDDIVRDLDLAIANIPSPPGGAQ